VTSEIERLLRVGRIERVEADPAAARDKLREAGRHLDSAAEIADTDPAGAYALVYDAARKAIDAHMLAAGYRASKNRPGAHEATARYASMALGDDARPFDRMRRNRNRSEYGVWDVGRSTLEADLEHARRIVHAVENELT
jgi:hypothetical protein